MNPPLNRADLIALCGRLPDSYEDYPFDDPNWTVMRHRTNRRSYALIFERQGRLWVNVNDLMNYFTPTIKPVGWTTDSVGRPENPV